MSVLTSKDTLTLYYEKEGNKVVAEISIYIDQKFAIILTGKGCRKTNFHGYTKECIKAKKIVAKTLLLTINRHF